MFILLDFLQISEQANDDFSDIDDFDDLGDFTDLYEEYSFSSASPIKRKRLQESSTKLNAMDNYNFSGSGKTYRADSSNNTQGLYR